MSQSNNLPIRSKKAIAIFITIWIMLGYIAASGNFAYWKNYPTGKYLQNTEEWGSTYLREHAWHSLFCVVIAPICFPGTVIFTSGFMYGFSWDWPLYLVRSIKETPR